MVFIDSVDAVGDDGFMLPNALSVPPVPPDITGGTELEKLGDEVSSK